MKIYQYRICVEVEADDPLGAEKTVDDLFRFLLDHGSYAGFAVVDVEPDQDNPTIEIIIDNPKEDQ